MLVIQQESCKGLSLFWASRMYRAKRRYCQCTVVWVWNTWKLGYSSLCRFGTRWPVALLTPCHRRIAFSFARPMTVAYQILAMYNYFSQMNFAEPIFTGRVRSNELRLGYRVIWNDECMKNTKSTFALFIWSIRFWRLAQASMLSVWTDHSFR